MEGSMRIVLLPGDGIGVEVMREGEKVLAAVQSILGERWDIGRFPCGGKFYLEHGKDWPDGAEAACRAADAIFLGAVGWPDPQDPSRPVTMPDGRMAGWSPVIGNRSRLGLYANVRPVRLFPNVPHRIHGAHRKVWDEDKVDMVFVRENTEGLYAGIGGIHAPGGRKETAVDVRLITRAGAERVIRFAFDLCRKRARGAPADGVKRLTCIVKDNVLDGCRLFAEVFQGVSKEYPDVVTEAAIVDAFTQWLMTGPEKFNVLVTTNMFGDIVTDLASVLQGGMGMALGANIGDEHAMFEPIHGSAPKHAGQDKANPIAMILAVAEGLRWLGGRRQRADLSSMGDAVEAAVRSILADGAPLTYDLVGEQKAARTSQVGDAVVKRLTSGAALGKGAALKVSRAKAAAKVKRR
ncbi:MAG: isocitrate/isopropylmalate dehydrogenase family protein [Planctomycetes bacterium]|nr:isocitrate/isopropylmalate dehydrogenase family protein [Planctomycetota bacterium]